MKQNRRGTENLDICFCVIFGLYSRSFIFESVLSNFDIFQIFPNFLSLNPLTPNATLFYPLETSESLTIFFMFSGGRERVHWEQMG